MTADSGWRKRFVGKEPPSSWQWVTGVLAIALAAERFATSLFYSRFGTSPEEVGIGIGESLVEGVVVFVAVYAIANVAVLAPSLIVLVPVWIGLRRSASLFRIAWTQHPGRTVAFVLHRLAWPAMLVMLLLLINRVSVVILGIALAAALSALVSLGSRLENPFTPAADQPKLPKQEIRRRALLLALRVSAGLAVVLLLAPTVWAIRDANAAKRGESVAGFPSVAWRAQRAQVSWLGQPTGGRPDIATHCLMYLGQADGIVVLFDVTDRTTLRLPTSSVTVAARPPTSSKDSC
jgi:hypothetical protein